MASRSTVALAIGVCLVATGCSGSLGEKLGFGKRAPDEFAVVKRQPLIVPPNYDLRPPDPNARDPLPGRTNARAQAALTGVPVEQQAGRAAGAMAAGSPGEAALVRRSAEVQADPEVRTRLAEEVGGPAAVDDALFEQLTSPRPANSAQPTAREALAAPGSGAAMADDLTLIRRSSAPLEDL